MMRDEKEAAAAAAKEKVQRDARSAADKLGSPADRVPTAEELCTRLEYRDLKLIAGGLGAPKGGSAQAIADRLVSGCDGSTSLTAALEVLPASARKPAAAAAARAHHAYARAQAAIEKPVPEKKRRQNSAKWQDSRKRQDDSEFAMRLEELRSSHDVDSIGDDDLTGVEVETIDGKKAEFYERMQAIAQEKFDSSGGLIDGWIDDDIKMSGDEKMRNRCAPGLSLEPTKSCVHPSPNAALAHPRTSSHVVVRIVDGELVTKAEVWLLMSVEDLVRICCVPIDDEHVVTSQSDSRRAWTKDKLDDVKRLAHLGNDGCGRAENDGKKCVLYPTSSAAFQTLRKQKGIGVDALFRLQDAIAKASGSLVKANLTRGKRDGKADAQPVVMRFLAGSDAAVPEPRSAARAEDVEMEVAPTVGDGSGGASGGSSSAGEAPTLICSTSGAHADAKYVPQKPEHETDRGILPIANKLHALEFQIFYCGWRWKRWGRLFGMSALARASAMRAVVPLLFVTHWADTGEELQLIFDGDVVERFADIEAALLAWLAQEVAADDARRSDAEVGSNTLQTLDADARWGFNTAFLGNKKLEDKCFNYHSAGGAASQDAKKKLK